MKVLGIETSCDESAVCLVEAAGSYGADFSFRVLGNALASQAALHAEYGGVFPNLAKREHARALVPLLEDVLRQAGEPTAVQGDPLDKSALAPLLEREPELLERLTEFSSRNGKPDIDCIAVTHGPGLEPALWVGVNFAKALSLAWGIPLVAVNHMEGHIFASLIRCEEGAGLQLTGDSVPLSETCILSPVTFPLLSLLISGGHTELVLSREFMRYERIGETRDDAAGEAFDKVARLLGLPYPGGPEISRLAAEARANSIEADFTFTRPMLHSGDYDFSFSGLKTEVRKLVDNTARLQGQTLEISSQFKMQVAREFEECVADVLITKTLRAIEEFGVETLVVGGGVSANTYIRSELARRLAKSGCTLLIPPPELATDNAIMIALAGYFRAYRGEFAGPDTLRAIGNLRLENAS